MKVRGLFSQNTQEQYEATQWFRKLLSIGKSYVWLKRMFWSSDRSVKRAAGPLQGVVTALCVQTVVTAAVADGPCTEQVQHLACTPSVLQRTHPSDV